MDVLPLRYSASIFTNSDDIKPEPTIVQQMFNEFIQWNVFPNIVKERGINIANVNGAIRPIEVNTDRLQFTSSKQNKKINFLSKRIDIEIIDDPSEPIGELVEFCNQVIKIVSVINKHSPKKANRLSLVTSYYCPNNNNDYMNKCYQALFTSSNLPLNSDPVDWSHRTTHRQIHTIKQKPERINFITTFGRGLQNQIINQTQAADRLEFHFDINTYQYNTDFRFALDDFTEFYQSIAAVSKQVKEDVVKLFLNV